MNVRLLAFIFIIAAATQATGQKGPKESFRIVTPPVIDGQVDDWQTDWLLDSKTKFLYNLANDDNNMYIRLKVSDQTLQQKIILLGLTLYFNSEGGSKRGKYGLKYPVEKNLEDMKKEQGGESSETKSWNDMKKEVLRDAETLELIGLDKDPILSARVGLMNGMEVIMVVDNYGDLVYEAKIPFKAFRMERAKIENMGVVVETGRIQMKQPVTSGRPMYYHGARYAPPAGPGPYNEYSSATILHLNFKLN